MDQKGDPNRCQYSVGGVAEASSRINPQVEHENGDSRHISGRDAENDGADNDLEIFGHVVDSHVPQVGSETDLKASNEQPRHAHHTGPSQRDGDVLPAQDFNDARLGVQSETEADCRKR